MNQAATDGITAIKLFNLKLELNQQHVKNQSKANELRAQINQDKEATAEERQAALDKINDLVTQAMTNITNDRTDQQVNDSTNQALGDIALVTPDHIIRAAARDAVKQQYEAKSKK